MKAGKEEAIELRSVYANLYENVLGPCINFEKSAIMFGANATNTTKDEVKNELLIRI